MARITAPSRPKINQPIRNATTAPIPIAAQFTDTIFHYLLSTILFSPWHRSPYVMPGTLSRVIGNPSIINYKIPTIKNKNCNRVMAWIMSRYFLLSLSRIHITTIRDGFFSFSPGYPCPYRILLRRQFPIWQREPPYVVNRSSVLLIEPSGYIQTCFSCTPKNRHV